MEYRSINAPRGVVGKVCAQAARPSALPMPADRNKVQAFTSADVLDRWTDIAADARPSALAKGDNVITMFDSIGYDFWTDSGVTVANVAAQLRAIGDRPVEVQINSFGGDMFEGIGIYNVLREHGQQITVKVMGMAASAASIIAMAGDRIEVGAASFVMIHNCWCGASGNRHDFAQIAEWLEPFDQAMADVYAFRANGDAKTFADLMDKESYISGSSAIALGLADDLLPADQIVRSTTAKAAADAAHPVRALELQLLASGKTRTEARQIINKIKGKPDAAHEGKQDAADPELAQGISALIASFKA